MKVARERAPAGPWWRARFIARLTIAASLAGACGRDPPPPPATQSVPLPDSADPLDLPEGPVVARGVRLPLGTRVTGESPALGTLAEVPYEMERVASYFRKRVDAASVQTGPQRTIFVGAKPHADGTKVLHISVRKVGLQSSVQIREERPVPVPGPAALPPSSSQIDPRHGGLGDEPEEPEP
jgi:hypothetical protein